ncbi:MAG: tetratricopeptide repeat protein [Bacteroidota bacterium]
MTNQHDIEKAIELFKKAYKLQISGFLEDAIKYYKKSLEAYPTAEARTFLGWTYSFMGWYEKAIEECDKAIEIDPDFGNPYNDIGAYFIELKRYEDAIPWLLKAKQAKRYESPQYPRFNLGRVYERLGKWQEALREYEEALELVPDYKLAYQALTRLQAAMN